MQEHPHQCRNIYRKFFEVVFRSVDYRLSLHLTPCLYERKNFYSREGITFPRKLFSCLAVATTENLQDLEQLIQIFLRTNTVLNALFIGRLTSLLEHR